MINNSHLYTLQIGYIIDFVRIMLNNRINDPNYENVQEVYQNRFV